nr:ABC-type multidrug transport system, ATPase component [Amycolatopsis sp.]
MQDAVVVRDLVKRYPKAERPAVDGLGFTIATGEVFGLLGPNGAGKTTTVSMLTTRALPTSGHAEVAGIDVVKHATAARQALAVVPQRNNLDQSLTVRQNLLFHAAYHGMGRAQRHHRADELIEWMGLGPRAKARVDEMSGGQAQRVMIARALMHRPKVMFLDEPATGLDPQSRLFVHERVAELTAEGVTVVVTTHDMEEAAKLCDRVGIVDRGKLLALDTTEALTRSLPGNTTLTVGVGLADPATEADAVGMELKQVPSVERVERLAAAGRAAADEKAVQFRLYTEAEPASLLPGVLAVLGRERCEVTGISFGKPTLEDVFISITGRDLR